MARQLPIVAVYPPDTRLRSIRLVMEGVFNAELSVGRHFRVGDAYTCIIDVRVPDGFAFHTAKRKIKKELPTVRISIMERFPEPRWTRPHWHISIGIAIGIVAGIAMVFISELLRPLVERMRGPPG